MPVLKIRDYQSKPKKLNLHMSEKSNIITPDFSAGSSGRKKPLFAQGKDMKIILRKADHTDGDNAKKLEA